MLETLYAWGPTCRPDGELWKRQHDSDLDDGTSGSIQMAESGKRTCPGDAAYKLGADLGSEIDTAGPQLADSSSSRLGADTTQHQARLVHLV